MLRSLILLALFVQACDGSSEAPALVVGDRAAFGGAEARAWVRTADGTDQGTPEAVGVTFDAGALDRLLADHTPSDDPMHGMFELALDLPDVPDLPFNHVALDWNPAGHEPPGLFDRPHVDVHFYLLSPDERDAISPADPEWEAKLAAAPADGAVPTGYVPTPGGVPRMGAHWIDTADPTYAPGGSFSEVLIYGFYDGRMAFVEPMLTQAFVASHAPVDEPLALPEVYPSPGYYPTRYTATYDAERDEYTVALAGFVQRD
ncbi:DUF5602 domain-containing protein [Rubrivirga sp. IMCC43871]|uniref:DUF5602 domain-containing protein n=1 Tax=Rubrivirga sp. IMCC43871 TaxID=3391575 RepID=UPI00399017E3